jgi:LAS superfamily LD-carboxypeptidase LdcB
MREMRNMRRIICVLIVLSVLSGCSSGKKTAPNPKPIENRGGTSQNPSGISSGQNNSVQVSEAYLGVETVDAGGKIMIKNPDSMLVLVDKSRNLPSGWKPGDMIKPEVPFPFKGDKPQMYMRKEAAGALENLFETALKDGIKLYAVSGYRSYSMQKRIYTREVKKSGVKAANKLVAVPGQSEHQTGLAMDVSCTGSNMGLKNSFENTKEGKRLKNHAEDAGFIIRYPKGKSDITRYSYEPWHIRYVGKQAAEYIVSHNITFDQYYTSLTQK